MVVAAILVLSILQTLVVAADLPTLYEYYTGDEITSGLSANQTYFTLNGKNISIYSGAMHYFRIPRKHWEDRLKKARAAGLNAVETYVPWNLHEPQSGVYDFGSGGSDFQEMLDLESFLAMAQAHDLFVIVRPGPYICAEWEWGGFPSWLLREDFITVRTNDTKYLSFVKRYFDHLLPILAKHQFTKGGPIIALQVENEYGSYYYAISKEYIRQLYDMMRNNGIVELLFSADGPGAGTSGTVPELLYMTVNFGSNPKGAFDTLKKNQPNRPIMAMEYWSGWFDHWSETHHTISNSSFRSDYETMLTYPGSVNMYMFHGGTNWGFLNGANVGDEENIDYNPTTTSYDYNAPLAENGDYDEKYHIVKELLEKYNPVKTLVPAVPDLVERKAYPSVSIDGQISFTDMIERAPGVVLSESAVSMEQLPFNNNNGQSYGYIIYHKDNITLKANSVLSIKGHVRDTMMVLVNGVLISNPLSSSKDFDGFGYWKLANSNITLTTTDLEGATLDLVVENWGRANFAQFLHQFKGLSENTTVYIDGEELSSWKIYPFEFKKKWNSELTGWKPVDGAPASGPGLYKATLTVDHDAVNEPRDTYIDMKGWTKGIVIVNGFVLGRYALLGPQQTLYLPFLKLGDNEIVIFEHFKPSNAIKFSKDPIFSTP